MRNLVLDSFEMMWEFTKLTLLSVATVIWILFISLLALVPAIFITIGLIYFVVKAIGYLVG